MTERNWTFSIQFESKNWAFFLQFDSKRIEPLLWTWLKDFVLWTWLKEFVFEHDSKNVFFNMTIRIEPFFCIWLWDLFFTWLKEVENSFFLKWLQESDFLFNMTQRIEPFFLNMIPEIEPLFQYKKNNSQMWTLLFSMTQRNWNFFNWNLLFNITQRIELFTTCLKDLNFLQCDSKNWTFFEYWLKELNFFLGDDAKTWTFYDSKNWTLFKMIQRTNFLHIFQNIDFFEYDSKNWTSFDSKIFWKTTRKTEHHFF